MVDLPILDPEPLRDLLNLGGSPELVQELIDLFREDVPIHLALLQSALLIGHVADTMKEAHGLKGSLGNLGLLRIADLADRIELDAKEGRMDEAARMGEALPAAYEEALLALNTTFPRT